MSRKLSVILLLILCVTGVSAAPKKKRVMDWRFVLAVAAHTAATAYDIESTHRAMRRCGGCVEMNTWGGVGPRPTRGVMWRRNGPFVAGLAVLSYWMKREQQRGGESPNMPLWALPQIGGVTVHTYWGRQNSRIPSDQSRKLVCPAGGGYNGFGGCQP